MERSQLIYSPNLQINICTCFLAAVTLAIVLIASLNHKLSAYAAFARMTPLLREGPMSFLIILPNVRNAMEEISDIDRTDTLKYKDTHKSNNRTPLVVTYHPDLPPMAQIVNKHFNILQSNDKLKQIFPEPPLISYRRPKNIRDIVVRAKLPPSNDQNDTDSLPGSSPCQSKRCKNCTHMKETNFFKSSITNQRFEIRQTITCSTSNAIYLIECSICNVQYVGETSKKNTRSYAGPSFRHKMQTH